MYASSFPPFSAAEGLGLGQWHWFFCAINKQPFCYSTAASGEFEVQDLLDHHVYGCGRSSEL